MQFLYIVVNLLDIGLTLLFYRAQREHKTNIVEI